jgi:hypothetical protein
MPKKHAKQPATPGGIYLQWHGKEHEFGKGSVLARSGSHLVFIRLECDCGVQPATLGMNLATAEHTARMLLKAVECLRADQAMPEPSVPGVFHA